MSDSCNVCTCMNKTGEEKKNCRNYIDYKEDDDCCLVAIEKNGEMTLEQVAVRIGASLQWVQQLEKKALKKIKKNLKIKEDF